MRETESEKKINSPEINGRGTLLIFNTGGLGRPWREREGVLNFKHFNTSSPLLNHPSTFGLLASTIGDSAPGIEKEEYEKKQAKKMIAASNLGRGLLHICPPLEMYCVFSAETELGKTFAACASDMLWQKNE
ncbi:hypothetical protein CDAR_189551 [Caerostris darwini]|uniref:Uncharacterized protein n=1 Tax=Caerostris darwini TaxID=1538125 RepID=A0AAV4QS72_9ARAC|nr:hypothetical protein CDAR_189551 [Caerostris darwini]